MEWYNFHCGDNVNLLIGKDIVAFGKVHATQPTDLCHGEPLGNGFLSVSIDRCLDNEAYLPFLTTYACMVNEVVGGFAKWERRNVQDIREIRMHDGPNDKGGKAASNTTCNVLPYVQDGISLCESWKERRVKLWFEGNKRCLGTGIILLSFPYEVINFDLLGEEDVGVVVDMSYDVGTWTTPSDNLDCINLVRWPIKRLTFEDGTPLLHEDLQNSCMHEDMTKDSMVDENDEFLSGQKSIFV